MPSLIKMSTTESAPLVNDGVPVTSVAFGFGWDVSGGGQKGWRAAVKRRKGVDLDASLIALDATGTPIGVAWYDNTSPLGGAMVHHGDNTTGRGDGDDETISAYLDRLPEEVEMLVCALSSYKGASFEKVNNATFNIYDRRANGNVLIAQTFLPVQSTQTGAIMATVRRTPTGWKVRKHSIFGAGNSWQRLVDLAVPLLHQR